MDDIEILYDTYSTVYNDGMSLDDFRDAMRTDGVFVEDITNRLYDYNDATKNAIDNLYQGGNVSVKGQEGNLTYETNEEVEAKKKRQEEIDNFVPKTIDGQVDFKYYEDLPMMNNEKYIFEQWLEQHPEANPSASDVSNYPSVTNQVGVELNYDPSEYIGVQIENVLKEEKEYREQKLKEDAEIYEAEEVEAPVVEQIFSEELFTPYDAAQTGSLFLQDDTGAEGFKLAFEDDMPDNIKFYTYESLREVDSEAPNQAKRMRANGQENFLFVQVTDKNGNKQVHKVKSFAEDEEDRQDPIKAQKEFINFISPYLNETALQKLQKKDKEISQKVSELFQSALNLTEKDFSFAPDATPEEKQNIINSANSKVKAGVLGIGFEDRQKIKEEVDSIDFGVTKTSSASTYGNMTLITQPHEEELKEALAEIKYQDVKNRVDRRNNPLTSKDSNGFTVYSDEVKDLARQKIAAKKENKLREDKIEAYLQGDVEGALPANLIRKYQVRGKKDAEFKAAKAEYLNTVARNDMINAQTNNFRNAKLLIDFVNDPSAKYNIKPGEKVVPLEDGRLVPLALFNNALKENQNFLDKKFVYDSTLNSFEKELSKMTDAEEQWDLLRRNYNDGAKFASQLGIATADLILNVAYGVKKLGDIVLPTSIAARYMMDNLGIEDPIDNAMNVWNNYKEETSSKFKKDQAFGEIETLADVGEYALQSIAQQTPIIVSMIATGGLSGVAGKAAGLTGKALTRLSTISSSSMIGLSSFGGKVSEMNYEEFVTGKDLYSDTETLVKGLMYGVVEGGLAAISTAPLISKGIGKASGLNLSRAVLDEAQEQGLRQFGKSFFTKELLPETLTEMGAEGLTTGLQNLIDGRPFFENMTETLVTSGIWGAGMSGSVGTFSLGARNFASTKQLGIITRSNKEITNYTKQINLLTDQKRRGVLSPSINYESEVKRLMDLIDQAKNTQADAINEVEVNIKKKGVREKRYLKDVSDSYGAAADIRQQAAEIVSNVENGLMLKSEAETQLDQLDKTYRSIMYHIDNFNSEGTFGDGYQAIAAKASWSAPFSDARKELRQINSEALDLIRKEKRDPNYKPSKQELENKGSDIVKNREIDTQLAKDKKLSSKLGLGFKDIQNSNLANLYINSEYNKKIQEAKDNNGKIKVGEFTFTVDELINERNDIIDGFKSGELNGLNSKVLQTSIVVRDNMYKNNMTRTGLHETTHGIVDELIAKNPNSFNKLVNQVDHYLKYTGQTDVLNKMRIDNANLLNKDGSYNTKEFIASFMENVADGKIDLEKMDNQIAVLGLLFNNGLKDATNNAFDVSFSGETEILQYFTSLGKAFKSGTNPALLIKKLSDAVEVDQAIERFNEPDQKGMAASKTKAANASLYERINTIYDSDESLDKRALKIGRAFENDIKSRLIKGYNLGKQFLQPSSWSGWDQEIQRDVISDTALGNSGVAGLVKSYANRDMSRFGNISLEAWINNRLNQRITGYLPKDLVRNELSIDEDVARQIEDAQAGRFDEAVTDTRKDDGPREIIPVEELKIITPELVDEVKDIITRTLKRTALTKGVSNETVLSDLNVAIEKEITKVIKSKMGPITRNVLGFAPKQYVDFIKDEMMTIVGSMPTNVIKQKAKSKAWAEIFKLTEIGREDIKKVNPDTGKVTNYRKQIFKLEKPDPQKFQRYFTRGGYTTLIERQKSLTRPMAQQLARSELARLRQDPNFIQDLAQRTGMTDMQVTEVFVDSVIQDIQAELDNTASEILQQDTVSFSKTLAEASSQDKQTFISGLRSDSFKSMLGQMLSNSEYFNKQGNTSALREAIITYFTGVKFDDLTPAKIKTIANDFGALQRPTFQRQISAEMKKFKAFDVADIVSEAFARRVEQQQDYNIIEADLNIFDVNFNKFDINSINQARAMALKIAQKIGKQKFLRVFAPGMMGPAGLGGLNMIAEPTSIKLTEADYDGFKKGNARAGIFKNRPDLERNVLNDPSVPDSTGDVGVVSNTGRYDSRVHKKDWYFSKKWEALDGDRSAQLEYIEEIAESGDDNKRIFRETVEALARDRVLTPTEARWFVATASEDMTGAIKNSASLIGFPDLNRKDLAESLNLKPNDKYVLEHMTPAKYMALLTYKYLLDPSAKNKSDFNTELDNFNTIILPEGVDTILRESGKQSSMGLQHKIGDSPFDTRYDEVLKIMKLVLRDGRVIGNTTSNFSKMNNRTATKNANVDLVNIYR